MFAALNLDLLSTSLQLFHSTILHQLIDCFPFLYVNLVIATRPNIASNYLSHWIQTYCLSFYYYFVYFFCTYLLSGQLFILSLRHIVQTPSYLRFRLCRLKDHCLPLSSPVHSSVSHLEPQWVNTAIMSKGFLLPSWLAQTIIKVTRVNIFLASMTATFLSIKEKLNNCLLRLARTQKGTLSVSLEW